MTRWTNHSGTTVNVPVVGRDVDDGEEIDVPDDVLLPPNYFREVGAPAPVPQPVSAAPPVAGPQPEEE